MRRVKRKYLALFFLSLAVFALAAVFPGAAGADIFYASSNYSTGSAGVITKSGAAYSVRKDVVSNFGVDAAGLTFKDHNGAVRAMIREYQYGPNDTVYVWNPADWKRPIVNTKEWGSNIHAATSRGQYLYLVTYESYKDGSSAQDTGEVVRVDMKNGYKADKRFQYKAFTNSAGFEASPHGEAVVTFNGKVYAMFGISYMGVNEYEPTEVIEFDADLNRLRSVKLIDGAGNIGKNAMRMAAYGGKLYVANMGGYQGPDSWGDIWEVDLAGMTARQVLDGHDLPYSVNGKSVNVGMYGIDFASDGTAFILTGSYGSDYTFRARLFVTSASRLAAGDAGSPVHEYTGQSGYSWDILWDEEGATLWCMAGKSLEARSKGGALARAFTPSEMGDNIYSIALLNGVAESAGSSDPADPGTPDALPSTPNAPDAPSGVTPSAPEPVRELARLTDAGLPGNWLTSGGDGYALTGEKAREMAEKVWDSVEETESLPAFEADAGTAGGTAAVSFSLKGEYLLAGEPGDIKLIKVPSNGEPIRFRYREDGYEDGTFRLQAGDGAAHTGAISSGVTYKLVMSIKDGGRYDLDGAENGTVLDPAVIVRTGNSGGNGQANTDTGGGGGGGCGSGAAFALALACVFAMKFSEKGKGGEAE
jgi:hypothetical protein